MTFRVKTINRSTKLSPTTKREAGNLFVFRVNKEHVAYVLRVRREMGIAHGSELKGLK